MIVNEALLAPTGMVSGPVQAGDPVQPGKVAIWTPEGTPSLTRTETNDDGSLAVTTRFVVTVAVSELPPATLVGFKRTSPIASGGGVTVMFWLIGAPAPLSAVTVTVLLEVSLVVATRMPPNVDAGPGNEVHPASIVKLPPVIWPAGLAVTDTLTPPNGARLVKEPCVFALVPPASVVMTLPLKSTTANEASGGMVILPPLLIVSDCGNPTRLRLWPFESL